MDLCDAIAALTEYGIKKKLISFTDRIYINNRLMAHFNLDEMTSAEIPDNEMSLNSILDILCNYAVSLNLIADSATERDLFDTALMGELTACPSHVQAHFHSLYEASPESGTEWFYAFCQDCNYIRRDRAEKDLHWVTNTQYGTIDITINLSKPEKDPRDIAAAKLLPQGGYPICFLCIENEGYSGRINHPARQNLRIIPLEIAGEDWGFQYSPYVYYNEHCILLNTKHIPMKIDRSAFQKLLSFVEQFPHYYAGSNADLPIVGGSILSHEHFQGGNYTFAMAKAPVEKNFIADGFDGNLGIVAWPMSVIRISHKNSGILSDFADRILTAWRKYTDESVFIYARTGDTPHNTVTPIARIRDGLFELDLVLRNNITTDEHPLGYYHPHAELHNIKKENIGLIEVMGLAVLPSRLKREMAMLEEALLSQLDICACDSIAKHAAWAESWMPLHPEFSAETAANIIREEIGKTFTAVLEHAGVFKRDKNGQTAFERFIASI